MVSIVAFNLLMKRSKCSDMSKRKVQYSTFQKWIRELDCECKTVTWPDCETVVEGGPKVVKKLKCVVSMKFRSQSCVKETSVIDG